MVWKGFPAFSGEEGGVHTLRGAPRIRPGGLEILERGRRGVGGVLLQLGGISLGPGASPKSKL